MSSSERKGRHRPFNRVSIPIFMMAAGACLHQPARTPDPASAAIVIHVTPSQQWTDSGLSVHDADSLFITATGEVFWSARAKTVGPDGVNGYPGWPVRGGGLIGRVGTKTFDIGARTLPFHSRNLREQTTHSPPPVRMPADGQLLLGFKDFKSGVNTGEFVVTVQRAK